MKFAFCTVIFILLGKVSYAQFYFLAQNANFVKSEIKKDYIVDSVVDGTSKEIMNTATPTITVMWGAALGAKDGIYKSIYYFKNNKCFAIREIYPVDEERIEFMVNRFLRWERQGVVKKLAPGKWENHEQGLIYFFSQPKPGEDTFFVFCVSPKLS